MLTPFGSSEAKGEGYGGRRKCFFKSDRELSFLWQCKNMFWGKQTSKLEMLFRILANTSSSKYHSCCHCTLKNIQLSKGALDNHSAKMILYSLHDRLQNWTDIKIDLWQIHVLTDFDFWRSQTLAFHGFRSHFLWLKWSTSDGLSDGLNFEDAVSALGF